MDPSREAEKFMRKFSEYIQREGESLMQDMFGNHVRVLITPQGVSVNEYDHG
jgi:hypothetical protein